MRGFRAMLLVVATLAVASAVAQDAVEIVIGGQIVARIRDKGSYDSLAARAAKVDQRIDDVISYEDTQNPKVKVSQVDGIWHVFCGDRPIVGVYAEDAVAQNIEAKALAAIWMRQIRLALPESTPVSKLPVAPAGTETAATPIPRLPTRVESGSEPPTGVRAASPTGTGEPSTAHVAQAPGTSTAPSGETVPPATSERPPEPGKTPRSAALLLLVSTFNIVRALTEEEYLAGRDRVASNLLENLEPFLTEAREEGLAGGTPQPPRPITVATTTVEETTPPTTPTPTPPTGVTAATPPTIPVVPTVPTVTGGTPESPPEVPPGVDPSRVRVPQKERIGRKFKAATQPYADLRASGGPELARVTELLKAARKAFFTTEDFDTAEANVDEALQIMGVPIPD